MGWTTLLIDDDRVLVRNGRRNRQLPAGRLDHNGRRRHGRLLLISGLGLLDRARLSPSSTPRFFDEPSTCRRRSRSWHQVVSDIRIERGCIMLFSYAMTLKAFLFESGRRASMVALSPIFLVPGSCAISFVLLVLELVIFSCFT